MSRAALIAPGRWCEIAASAERRRPGLFLDRDGVVVEEVNFLHRPADMRLVPGAARTVGGARRAGYAVVLVTNQSGIGRGLYAWSDFAAVQEALCAGLLADDPDARFDTVLACAEHPEGEPPYRVASSDWRKPAPGMVRMGLDALELDAARSLLVGDRALDLAAAKAAGLPRGILVATGYGGEPAQRTQARALADETFAVDIRPSIAGLF